MQSTDRAHFNSLYTQATVLYQTKRYFETIAYAQKALTILPADPRPYALIALAMACMRNPEAPEWAKKAIVKDPTSGVWRGYLGDTYSIRGKWKEALQPLREAVYLFSPTLAWSVDRAFVSSFEKVYRCAFRSYQGGRNIAPEQSFLAS